MSRDRVEGPDAGDRAGEDLVVVVETPDATAVSVVTSLLESEEIPFVVRGADRAGLDTVVRHAAGMLMKPRGIRVLVPVRFRELAEQLLASPGEAAELAPDDGGPDPDG